MRKFSLSLAILSSLVISFFFTGCNSSEEEMRSYYKTLLVCGTNKEIGCGSRVKPFFLETEKQHEIKESWINREGTAIAIVWNKSLSVEEKESIVQPLFKKCEIEATYISDEEKKKELTESFFSNHAPTQKGKDKWYTGAEVDQLSLEEAVSIGDTSTAFALKAGLINEAEAIKIKREITEYMRAELVKVRSFKELTSEETDLMWKKYGYEIYVKYIGTERAEKVRDFYIDYQKKTIKTPDNETGKSNILTNGQK